MNVGQGMISVEPHPNPLPQGEKVSVRGVNINEVMVCADKDNITR